MSDVNDERIKNLADEVIELKRQARGANDSQTTTLVKLTEIQLNLARQDEKLDDINHTVNGNGKPGLVQRVGELETEQKIAAAKRRDWKKFGWLFAGAVLTFLAEWGPHLFGRR